MNKGAFIFEQGEGGVDAFNALRTRADDASAPLVTLHGRQGEAWNETCDRADLVVGVDGDDLDRCDVVIAEPFSIDDYNPLGWRAASSSSFAMIDQIGNTAVAEGVRAFMRYSGKRVTLFSHDPEAAAAGQTHGYSVLPFVDDAIQTARQMRQYRGVIDHANLYSTAGQRASWLVRMAAAGVPVILLDDADELSELVHPELLSCFRATTFDVVGNPGLRRAIAFRTARASMKHHSFAALWRRLEQKLDVEILPREVISVLAVTRRPELVEHIAHQLSMQTYPHLETILVTHGREEEFNAALSSLSSSLPNCKLIRASEDLNLGECLNLALDEATGTFVSKFDDDDIYDQDHFWDLVLAHEYSGATLVGKPAEFIYFGDVDVTVRRALDGLDAYDDKQAGGTLFLLRQDALDVGGWHNDPREIDRRLIGDVYYSGGNCYRIQGLGFVLNRHGQGHTWDVGQSFFVPIEPNMKGLALDQAGFS